MKGMDAKSALEPARGAPSHGWDRASSAPDRANAVEPIEVHTVQSLQPLSYPAARLDLIGPSAPPAPVVVRQEGQEGLVVSSPRPPAPLPVPPPMPSAVAVLQTLAPALLAEPVLDVELDFDLLSYDENDTLLPGVRPDRSSQIDMGDVDLDPAHEVFTSHANSETEQDYDGTPPRSRESLAQMKRRLRGAKIGFDPEDTCENCGRKGHTKFFCANNGSPLPGPADENEFMQYVYGLERQREKWVQWAADNADLSLPSRLEAAKERLQEIAAPVQAANPYRQAPTGETQDRLRENVGGWYAAGLSNTQLSWITTGFGPRPAVQPERLSFPNHPGCREGQDSPQSEFMRAEISKQTAAGVYEEVEPSEAVVINPLDVIAKPSAQPGKAAFRAIVDMRYVNSHMPDMGFRMEDLSDLSQVVNPGDWLVKIDLSDAFYHCRISKAVRPWFCFQYEGRTYRSKAAPFGFSLSPFLFCKLSRSVVAFLRTLGIRTLSYVDDWLFAASSREEASALAAFVLWLFSFLGFEVNKAKSVTDPRQEMEFLGMIVDTIAYRFFVTEKKRAKVIGLLQSLRQRAADGELVHQLALQQLAGHLVALRMAVPLARLFTRQIYKAAETARATGQPVLLEKEAQEELEWWLEKLPKADGHPIVQPEATKVMHSDASDDGWGAWCGTLCTYGSLPLDVRAASSTARELYALEQGLSAFGGELAGRTVLARLDNEAAVKIIDRAASHSDQCAEVAKRIFAICEESRINLLTEWIPRERNKLADDLSRVAHDWILSPAALDALREEFKVPEGQQLIDRFPRDDRFPDSLSAPWLGEEPSLVNPPFHLIGRAVEHMRVSQTVGVVVYPGWCSQAWWPALQSAAVRARPIRAGDLMRLRKGKRPDQQDGWERGSFQFPVWAAWVDFRRGASHTP